MCAPPSPSISLGAERICIIKTQQRQHVVRSSDRVSAVPGVRQIDLPETLLDRIEEAQQQIDDLKGDISLLQTEKKALDLISRNLSKIRRLTHEKHRYPAFDSAVDEINGRIRNLLRINRRVESIRFKGHPLLKNTIIQMNSAPAANLYLRTTKIPEIEGVETGDMQATLVSLDDAARAINEQYQRLRSVMRQLLEYYQQLQSEIDVLILAQARLHQTDD